MRLSRRQTIPTSLHPRRTGNLFTIDASAVSEARQFSSKECSASSFDDDSVSDSFIFDTFCDLPSVSQRPSVLVSSMRSSDSRKRPLQKVSFAASIETVHVVDNLKTCLTKEEKRDLWEPTEGSSDSGSSSSGELSPLESALSEAFCLDDGPSMRQRKDSKRRRRKTQSKLRAINKTSTPLSPILSPMRSLTSRLGFRNRERMQTGILVPF